MATEFAYRVKTYQTPKKSTRNNSSQSSASSKNAVTRTAFLRRTRKVVTANEPAEVDFNYNKEPMTRRRKKELSKAELDNKESKDENDKEKGTRTPKEPPTRRRGAQSTKKTVEPEPPKVIETPTPKKRGRQTPEKKTNTSKPEPDFPQPSPQKKAKKTKPIKKGDFPKNKIVMSIIQPIIDEEMEKVKKEYTGKESFISTSLLKLLEKFQEEVQYIPDSVIEDAKIDDTKEWTELRKKYDEKTKQALEKESKSTTNVNEILQTLVLELDEAKQAVKQVESFHEVAEEYCTKLADVIHKEGFKNYESIDDPAKLIKSIAF